MAAQISASQFKEQCLSLLDHLDPDGLVITKHGKPVAKLIPDFAAHGKQAITIQHQIGRASWRERV